MLARILTALLLAAPTLAQSFLFDPSRDDPDAVLQGRVVDVDGSPVAGANVELRTRVQHESVDRGQAATGLDGRFVLRVKPVVDSDYFEKSFLSIEAAGFAPSMLDRVFVPPPELDLGDVVVYRPLELRGRVRSSDGRPIAGAEIHASLGPSGVPHFGGALNRPLAITDAKGEYSCRALPPGLVRLGASATGFADRLLPAFELRADQANTASFVLLAERLVCVSVVTEDGKPLSSARADPLLVVSSCEANSLEETDRAYWREGDTADEQGRIFVRGMDASSTGTLRVFAPGHRPAEISLDDDVTTLTMKPVTFIDVVASRKFDGPAPEIYMLVLRDGTRKPSWCGNCDDSRLAKLWADSPAVERLAPNRWRVAWNGEGCTVDGGRLSNIHALAIDGSRANLKLPEDAPDSDRSVFQLEFEAPGRVTGTVVDESGTPVSLRLGTQLALEQRAGFLSADSAADGKFGFDPIGAGKYWLHSLDDQWEIDSACEEFDVAPGAWLKDLRVVVRRQPDGRTGVARGVLHIDGKIPSESVLIALDEVPNQHLPSAYPRGFAWTDAQGGFEIRSFWPRDYHIVPKRSPAHGGWRDFAAEFPEHDERWRWKIEIPASGSTFAEFDLPPESEWDQVAPPDKR